MTTPRLHGPSPALRRILLPFVGVLLLFIAVNLLAIQVMSDCGLPALLGLDACSDDVVRAGWPFEFYARGGLVSNDFFSLVALAGDVIMGVVGAVLLSVGAARLRRPQ